MMTSGRHMSTDSMVTGVWPEPEANWQSATLMPPQTSINCACGDPDGSAADDQIEGAVLKGDAMDIS